jgi:enamine deaminase RidA (YjgF/YER057c/UK114 family)
MWRALAARGRAVQDRRKETAMPPRAIVPPAFRAAAEAAHMSPGIVSGGHLFMTGVTGSDPSGQMPPDIEAQFHAVFDKVAGVLECAGLDLGAVVEMTSYHVGLRDHFERFDAVRVARLHAPYPAWTAVEVAGLRREGAVVELRVIAASG